MTILFLLNYPLHIYNTHLAQSIHFSQILRWNVLAIIRPSSDDDGASCQLQGQFPLSDDRVAGQLSIVSCKPARTRIANSTRPAISAR